MGTEKPYKLYQRIYNDLVKDHEDDLKHTPWVLDDEIVENAIRYFEKAEFPLVYPAKSYSVAVIYAKLIEEKYGIPLRETLDDEDLFLGGDEFFKPYREDPYNYESILQRLDAIEDWLTKGFAPMTARYFYLECTEEGINEVISSGNTN